MKSFINTDYVLNDFPYLLWFCGIKIYSKEEIAEISEISRPTLYRIWPVLEGNGLLKETRKYGNAKLYKINEENLLEEVLQKHKPGDIIKLKIDRGDKILELTLKTGELK